MLGPDHYDFWDNVSEDQFLIFSCVWVSRNSKSKVKYILTHACHIVSYSPNKGIGWR